MRYLHKKFVHFIAFCVSLAQLTAAYCGGYYKGMNGVITSPSFPSSYAKDLYCLFTVSLPGKRIHVKWNYFNIPGLMPDCKNDFVRIASCASPWSYNVRYCNSTKPNDIFSYDNCLRIEFRSTSKSFKTDRKKGFKIAYRALDMTKSVIPSNSNCLNLQLYKDQSTNKTTYPYYVNILTPLWPLSYSKHASPNICKRRIYLKPKTQIKIHVMETNLYRKDGIRRSCFKPLTDYFVIKGVTDRRAYTYIYCGNHKPFTVSYNRNFKYVEISFVKQSKHHHSNRGFALSVSIFKESRNKMKHRFVLPLIPTVIAFAFISALLFCAVRNLRRRYQSPQRLRAYMQRTHSELHDGNVTVNERVEITPNVYTLPPPPPYTANGYPMATTNANSGQFIPNPDTMGSGIFKTVQPISPNSQQTSYDVAYPSAYPDAPPSIAQPQQYPTSYPVNNESSFNATPYSSTNPFRNPNDVAPNLPPSYETVGTTPANLAPK